MADILSFLGGVMSAPINAYYTQRTNQQNAALNNEYWNQQARVSYSLNEKAADNAMKRSIDLYNILQSPESMVEQLKKAGLNPALMYSNSGMGGHTQQGPMGGTNASAQGAPLLGLQQLLDPLTLAQVKNIEADTKNKEADTVNKDANTNKTKEETENIKINQEILKTTKKLTNLEFDLKESTFWHEYNKIASQMYYWQGMAQTAVAQGTLQQESLNTMIETTQQNLENLKMEYEVNKKLIKKYGTEIENNKELKSKIIAEKNQILQITKNLEEQIKLIRKDINLREKQATTEEEKAKILQEQKQLIEKQIEEYINKYEWSSFTKEDLKYILTRRVQKQQADASTLNAIIPF